MTHTHTLITSIYSPFNTFKELSYSKNSIKYGWIATIGFAVMYTITAIILTAKGWLPVAKPSLPIHADKYYFFNCNKNY